MSQVVKQCRAQTDTSILFVNFHVSINSREHSPGGFHHADAVAVAGMIGAGIGHAGHAELADATQALKFSAVEQREQEPFDRIVAAQHDDIVNGISDDLFGHLDLLDRNGLIDVFVECNRTIYRFEILFQSDLPGEMLCSGCNLCGEEWWSC